MTAWHWLVVMWHEDLHLRRAAWHILLYMLHRHWADTIYFIALWQTFRRRDSIARRLVRWRQKIPGKPDERGWRARTTYERKDPS